MVDSVLRGGDDFQRLIYSSSSVGGAQAYKSMLVNPGMLVAFGFKHHSKDSNAVMSQQYK